jgi:acetyltransferase-like isoleucine patch superfamily enzyme
MQDPPKKSRESIDPRGSDRAGLVGLYEKVLRASSTLVHALTLIPIFMLGGVLVGLAIAPSVFVSLKIMAQLGESSLLVQVVVGSICLGVGLFASGLCLMLIVPIANLPFRFLLKPDRGPYYSVKFLPWVLHNALTYLVRYTVIDWYTPSPFTNWFYIAMGLKAGRGVQINSSNLSDPALITLEDKVTVGGSATIIAHYGQGGFLIVDPVRIRKKATIGLKATIMGGVDVGEGSLVMPNSFVLPKTQIPANEIWGGVPAVKIRDKE